jgi:hypothetical protein
MAISQGLTPPAAAAGSNVAFACVLMTASAGIR